MKRCPTCKREFTDDTLSFCLDDGTPLVSGVEASSATGRAGTEPPPTWVMPGYQPPSYTTPVTTEKRRTWPWVVTLIGFLLLALVGVTVAAVVFIPRFLKQENPAVAKNEEPNVNSERPLESDKPDKSNTNGSVNANSSINANDVAPNANRTDTNSNSNANTNTNSAEGVGSAPTDKELVIAQLKDLENEWTIANINADKKKLARILADDYVSARADGRMQGKAEYIDTIQRDTQIEQWEIHDLRVTLRGDRATLYGKIRFRIQARYVVYSFVDKFVWRDGRWQATGSVLKQIS